jgi:primase-polymerase (primpol)-like protein
MTVTTIDLYNILKSRIGEKEAKTLVEFVERKVEMKFDEHLNELATKKDLYQVRADMIKWMFIFWIGQVSVTIAMVLLLVK